MQHVAKTLLQTGTSNSAQSFCSNQKAKIWQVSAPDILNTENFEMTRFSDFSFQSMFQHERHK